MQDIESHNKRLKVFQGKGAKDRYTLLPEKLLHQLRLFYVEEGRPKEHLFTSKQTKRAIHVRSMQVIVNSAMIRQDLKTNRLRHILCAIALPRIC